MASIDKIAPQHYQDRAHFKECCIYQVYPASFCDSNGDGVGDVQGIISKLDYLKDLGVVNYHEIDARFGTLADVDELILEMHRRDMKLVMDLVVNHRSDQHQWFVESRKSKDNPYRDFFWWKAPKYSPEGERLPPNNWREEFSTGSAWEWDETTQEYYLHLYCKEQPDLNWENPKLRQAVYDDIMKWWLDRGCDGFRMDVINLISKVPSLPDAPIKNPGDKFQEPYKYCANGPRVHEFLQEMNREVLSMYPNLITVGETPFTHHDFDVLVPYVLPENKELQTIFQFEQQEVDGYPQLVPKDYQLSEFKEITSRWQVEMQKRGGWNSIYLEVKLAVRKSKSGHSNPDVSDIMDGLQRKARDHARNPMQWDDSHNAGFSLRGDAKPWMRVHDDYRDWNVAKQIEDPDSVLSFWKRMLAFRKEHLSCTYGYYTLLSPDDEKVFAYVKEYEDERMLVLLNFTKEAVTYPLPKEAGDLRNVKDSICNYNGPLPDMKDEKVELRPYEALVIVT
ncbi:hypothetical protein B0A54_06070 [Friedmanniomyces endolithicus]|uniref:Glycosyl hydrolase family 13 catalytic domain-containing protein n=1 Tax=Friedmanniomyces endolithicus TaxID=329885 RepID=A0A4U0V4A1_9PEZI|nr:hypothetical protein B0A54_06070 [Friedmanniomyces endolithicus]